jgi:protein-disulfide isomerase
MKTLAIALAPLALLACSGTEAGNSTSPAAPVAAVNAPAGQVWTDVVSKTDEGYRVGNPNAPIKLVEYGARTCPACAGLAQEGYQPLMSRYVSSGKVSFEFRDYMVHGAADVALTLLGSCAATPATFFPLLEQMYANQTAFLDRLQQMAPAQQQALQGKSPVQVAAALGEAMGGIDFVKQRGIPEAKARQCLTSQAELEKAVKATERASADGSVTGTPTLIVNGNKVDGITWADLEKALKAAGA